MNAAISDPLGNAGQALAGWISAVLSLLAIGATCVIFIAEARRNRKEESKKKKAFVAESIRIVDESVTQSSQQLETMFKNSSHASLVPWQGIAHVNEPLQEYASALQMAAPREAGLALTLARTRRTLSDLADYRGLPSFVSKAELEAWLKPLLVDLAERRSEIVEQSGLSEKELEAALLLSSGPSAASVQTPGLFSGMFGGKKASDK
jgi:hypothetical protein